MKMWKRKKILYSGYVEDREFNVYMIVFLD